MGHPFGAVGEQLFGAVHAFGVAAGHLQRFGERLLAIGD